MKLIKQYFNTLLALLPLLAVVLFVHFFIYKFETSVIIAFISSIGIVSFGETLLLLGIDSTIMPMGEYMVSTVTKISRLIIFVLFAVCFGMFATIAEPDVAIFSGQVVNAGVDISKSLLTFLIGAGVGLFIAFGILKIIKKIDAKYVYLTLFAIIFILCTQVDKSLIALAFDAGGATTGIVTAPFLIAIAAGISSKFSNSNEKQEVFGMVGIASIGPIIITLIIFMVLGTGNVEVVDDASTVNIFLSSLNQAYMSILPIAFIFLVYDLVFIKLPIKKKLSLFVGLVITFIGLYLFLIGIDFGIGQMATKFGEFLSTLSVPVIILISVIIGFIITFTEPAVVVLAKRVSNETHGNIPFSMVLISIAVSMALAIALAVLKIVYGWNFFIIVLIGYLIALILMFFVPSIFTNLAFDSGGVASGPMTAGFLLPIMLSLASNSTSAIEGFGIVGIVAMTPIVVVQLLGLVYGTSLKKKLLHEQRHAIKLSYSKDIYSNIEPLEKLLAKKNKRRKANEK